MMQDETETCATFEIVPDEVRMHIARYLDTKSLCFFAATSRRSLGNALAELKQRRRPVRAQLPLQVQRTSTFCYTSHSLYACGSNRYGQLGLGHTNDCEQLTRVENVPGTVLQVAAGGFHTLVLTDQGLYACGNNRYGQLGLGHNNDCEQLTRVESMPGAVLQVVAGGYHTFVLTDQGLYACGFNHYGQLGLGHNEKHCNQLTRVDNVPGAVLQVVAGDCNTFVLTDQGLYACGRNRSGELGHRRNKCNQLRRRVEYVHGTVLQMAAGGSHTLVLTDQGLYACGDNGDAQLGLGYHSSVLAKNFNLPQQVKHIKGTLLQVVTGGFHTFVLTDQGLYACGRNRDGQLGLGHTNDCEQLTRVENVPGTLLQVMAGVNYTFVLTNQGLYACGCNQNGQLGLGDKNNRSTFTPVNVQLDHLIAIAFSRSDVAAEQNDSDALPLAAKHGYN